MRIEDTDVERSKPEFEKDIIENLEWLGLDWDEGPPSAEQRGQNAELRGNLTNSQRESASSPRLSAGPYGPYRQSERTEIYKKYLEKLLAEHHAYYCFCTKEELEEERQARLAQGMPPKYGGKCRGLTAEEAQKRTLKGESAIIRFKTPETKISFHDLIRGLITFDMNLVGDFAIAKSVTEPLYNFSAAVDDEEMEISHVLRGEDHIANTPKQIVLQKALEFNEIHYAHFPLILDADRHKMSKRYSAAGVGEYRQQGYLPEALFNFLALLGWRASEDDKEIMAKEELITKFDLRRVQKGGAVFSIEKLDWMNGQYIKFMGSLTLIEKIREFTALPKDLNDRELIKIADLAKSRMKKLTEFEPLSKFFWELPEYQAELLVWKSTPRSQILANLRDAAEILSGVRDADFEKTALEQALQKLAAERGMGAVLWPIRAALSGSEYSPGPYEIMDILGKKRTLERLTTAIKKLENE